MTTFSPAWALAIPFSTSSSVSLSDSAALARSASALAAVRRAISIWIGTSLRKRARSAFWRSNSASAKSSWARDVDLVAVRDRVDLRHDLPPGNAVVLLDQELDDLAGDPLRSEVDDVGLDERVVGGGVGAPVVGRAHHHSQAGGDQGNHHDPCDEFDRDGADGGDRRDAPAQLRPWGLPRCSTELEQIDSRSWLACR